MSQMNATGPRAKSLQGAYSLENPAEAFQDAIKLAQKRGEKPAWTSERNTGDAVAKFTRTVGEFPITVAIEGNGGARIDIGINNGGRPVDLTDFTADQLKAATQGLPPWVQPRVQQAINALPKKKITAPVDVVVDHVVKKSGGFLDGLFGGKRAEPAPAKVSAAIDAEVERRQKVISTFEEARATLEAITERLPADDTHAAFHDTAAIFRKTLSQAVRATADDQAFTQAMRLGWVAPLKELSTELATFQAKNTLAGNGQILALFEKRMREINDPIVDKMSSSTRADIAGAMVAVAGANAKDALAAAQSAAVAGRVAASGYTVASLRAEKRAVPARIDDIEHIWKDNAGARSVASFLDLAQEVLMWGDSPQPYAVFPRSKNPDAKPFGPESLYIWKGGFTVRDDVEYVDVTDEALRNPGGEPATVDAITASLENAAAQIEEGMRNYFRPLAADINEWKRSDLFFQTSDALKRGMSIEERQRFHQCLADVGFDMPVGFGTNAQAATQSQAQATAAASTAGALMALDSMFQTKGSSAQAVATFLAGAGAFMAWAEPQPYAIFGSEQEGPTSLNIWAEGFAWRDPTSGEFRAASDDDLANYGVGADKVDAALESAAEKIEAGLRTYFRGQGLNTDKMNRGKLIDGLKNEAWKADDAQRAELAKAMQDAGFPIA